MTAVSLGPGLVGAARVRESTRRMVAEEIAWLVELRPGQSRLACRSLVLAFVTGYLHSFTDQITRDHTAPDEIAAVLAGVLDVIAPDTANQPDPAAAARTA